jgi:NAD(P)-dependent dehydrogenase (short-subunit alcohol dehydrogenase family)
MQRILITGASRGIGLDLTRRYAQRPDTQIYATARQPDQAAALQNVAAEAAGRVRVLPLDVTDPASVTAAVSAVQAQASALDILINNAGVLPGGVANREPNISQFGALEAEAMLHVFHVNSIAPVLVAQAFSHLLWAGDNPRLINVSSDAGSIANRARGCDFTYPASKAALNMMTRCLAGELRPAGVIVVSMHPGFIRTDMGGPNAHMTLEDTMPSFIRVVDQLTMADSGTFLNWDGQPVPW